ncbi:MAG: gluconate 2-dehydrogenase subunit 3 family protein, partial [Blastocatellia bacterium]
MGKNNGDRELNRVKVSGSADEIESGSAVPTSHKDRPSRKRHGFTRRQMLKLAAGAVVVAPLADKVMNAVASTGSAGGTSSAIGAAAGAASTPGRAIVDGPLFFTKEQYAMLDELTEMIIPTDDHSPGARAAKVAEYIDKRLSEEFEDKVKQSWRDGMKAVDNLSQEMNQKSFMELTADQRLAVMTKMASGANNPDLSAGKFFGELKGWTAFGYYTTKIGIHQEMEYKGNVPQREFSGYDVT